VKSGSKARILVVDDEEVNRTLLTHLLDPERFETITASDGRAALDAVAREAPDIILLDLSMPGMTGFEVAENLKRDKATAQIPIIILTAWADRESRLKALNHGVEEFLSKPFDPTELLVRVRNLVRLKEYSDLLSDYNATLERQVQERTGELLESYRESIYLMVRAAEYRDDDTGDHVRRIGFYASHIASVMGFSDEFVDCIFHASTMHDIGKIGIPDSVLLKPGALTPDEWVVMRSHTVLGKEILEAGTAPYMKMGAVIALTHHERWDGSGYPGSLSGTAIPIEGRIMKICDEYDALRSRRPYKPALDHDAVVEILSKGDGRTRPEHFAPEVLSAFLHSLDDFKRIYDENQ
jgi:cyclic di-GMP phosphodiesterase